MKSLIVVGDTRLPRVYYRGKPIIPLPLVDALHGRPANTAGKSFRRNRDRMVEGRDYFDVAYEEWALLVDHNMPYQRAIGMTFNDMPKKNKGGHTGNMIFLTEAGYFRVIKPFNDDRSWEVLSILIDAYFHSKPPAKPVSLEEREHMRSSFLSNTTINQIARDTGRSRSTVQRHCDDLRAEKAGQTSFNFN